MHPMAERGIERSTVDLTDCNTAFYVEGWFSGYGRSGLAGCPYLLCSRQGKAWRLGYLKGAALQWYFGSKRTGRVG